MAGDALTYAFGLGLNNSGFSYRLGNNQSFHPFPSIIQSDDTQ
jgi:hypothetical protein